MKNKVEFLKYYAGSVTALLALVVYIVLMFRFTQRDMLEIIVTYMCFIFFPTFLLPFIITEDKENDAE